MENIGLNMEAKLFCQKMAEGLSVTLIGLNRGLALIAALAGLRN